MQRAGVYGRERGGGAVDLMIVTLLILAAVKFVLITVVLWVVWRPDVRKLFRKKETMRTTPVCPFCDSRWTHPVGDPETGWDGDELVLSTTYECQHCHFPIRHVERVPVGASRSR